MFVQRQTCLRKVRAFTVTVLLLLATTGTSEVLNDSPLTTASPTNLSLTDQTVNGTLVLPKVQFVGNPCGAKNGNYCFNGGKCMYHPDEDRYSCHCMPLYEGKRCEGLADLIYSPLEVEKVIAIIFGMIMVFTVLGLAIYCFVKRRCVKSSPLIKAAASESSV